VLEEPAPLQDLQDQALSVPEQHLSELLGTHLASGHAFEAGNSRSGSKTERNAMKNKADIRN
jgi:hypothetical protein